jgi:predicted transcriptional regulator
VASLGELERAVMERLWAAEKPVAATTLRDELGDRGVALTTVHTVLTRLEQKGFVVHDDERPRRFAARASREEHAAELMHEVLGQSADRQAVLARFVGGVDPAEARLLRELLADDAAR